MRYQEDMIPSFQSQVNDTLYLRESRPCVEKWHRLILSRGDRLRLEWNELFLEMGSVGDIGL